MKINAGGGRRLLAGFWGGCTVCPGKSIGVTSELLQEGCVHSANQVESRVTERF